MPEAADGVEAAVPGDTEPEAGSEWVSVKVGKRPPPVVVARRGWETGVADEAPYTSAGGGVAKGMSERLEEVEG